MRLFGLSLRRVSGGLRRGLTVAFVCIAFFGLAGAGETATTDGLAVAEKNGLAAQNAGEYQRALAIWQAALVEAKRRGSKSYATELTFDVGVAQESLGQLPGALRSLQGALRGYSELNNLAGEARVLSNIGLVDERLSSYADALSSYGAALSKFRQMGDQLGEAIALTGIAIAYLHLGHYDEAREAGHTAAAIARKLRFADEWQALQTAAAAEARLNRRDEALADFTMAIDKIEQPRLSPPVAWWHPSPIQEGLSAYDDYVTYLSELDQQFPHQGYDRQALRLLERKLARTIVEEIGNSAARHFAGIPHPIDAAAIQRSLQPGELLLVYDVLDKQSVLWMLGREPEQFQLALLPGVDELRRDVTTLRKHLTIVPDYLHTLPGAVENAAAQDLTKFSSDSYALYQKLLPATVRNSPTFEQAKSLVIVPSGPLRDIPWEVFITQRGPVLNYLIQNYPISYAPSASFLSFLRARQSAHKAAPNPLLVFAHPTPFKLVSTAKMGRTYVTYLDFRRPLPRSGYALLFGPLPGTYDVAERVRLVVPAADVYTDASASRQHVLALNQNGQLKTYQYILFATHAVLSNRIPGLSQPTIVLAGPARGDVFLTMVDVFGLSLNADLVVLTGCDAGASSPNKGPSGLALAFLYAGTPAISVALWEVDDRVPAQMIPEFFTAIKAGATPAQALRLAKLGMLDKHEARFRHPSAWAPSVILGDGDATGLSPPKQVINARNDKVGTRSANPDDLH